MRTATAALAVLFLAACTETTGSPKPAARGEQVVRQSEQDKRQSEALARLEAMKRQDERDASLGAFKVQLVKAGAWEKFISEAAFDPNGGSTLFLVSTYELMNQPRQVRAEFAHLLLRSWRENGGAGLKIVSPAGRVVAESSWDGTMKLEE